MRRMTLEPVPVPVFITQARGARYLNLRTMPNDYAIY